MGSKDSYWMVALTSLLVLAVIGGSLACGTTSGPKAPGILEPLAYGPGNNGLPARSLLSNAVTLNPKALRTLIDNPLNDALFDANKQRYLSLQLTDSRARDVMEYVVSCALDPSQQVSYTEPSSHAVYTWNGEMGLCRSWNKSRPSEECLHLVSSCLFARTNRLGRQVPVRFQGAGFQPRPKVEITTLPARKEPMTGPSQERGGNVLAPFLHGWNPGYVGRCLPGKPITLSIRGASRCTQTALRVCKGVRGCEPEAGGFLHEKSGPCEASPLTFTCPDEGFFGVMTRTDRQGPVEVVQRSADAGVYPAPEATVFSFLEGAFYGNLFDPEGLTRFREVILEGGQPRVTGRSLQSEDEGDEETIPHRNIYSCYSLDNAEEGIAYLNGRICAKPDAKKQCFPNPPQPCRFKDTGERADEDAVCRRRPNGRWECQGSGGARYPALAVLLAEPCGLTDSGCANLPRALRD